MNSQKVIPMKKLLLLACALSLFCLFGCVTPKSNAEPEMSQLQIREYQTRTYETNDTKMVIKAVINVLQDEGYMFTNTDSAIGLVSVEKSVNAGKSVAVTEGVVNISEFGQQTRVRINFRVKTTKIGKRGTVTKINQIIDEQYYQDFFIKVDKGVFLQKEKL